MRKIVLLLLFILSISIQAQESEYKFVTLPTSFDFMKEPNQYNLNELSKFLIGKKGIVAFFETEEKSIDYNLADPCNILKLNVTREKVFMVIKLKITLTDCNGRLVTESTGSSREKDFKVAYNYALREAFNNLTIPQNTTIQIPVAVENNLASDNILNAEKTQSGYKLLDSQKSEKYTLYKTSRNDMFIVTNPNGNGILYKNGTTWILEYFDNQTSETITTTLKITF